MRLLWQILTHFRLDNTLKYFPLNKENLQSSTSRGCVWQIGSKNGGPHGQHCGTPTHSNLLVNVML